MARRLFGRSRANTATQISKPTLTFSDAVPRDDLQLLGRIDSPRSQLIATGRPRTASGRSPQQAIPNNISAFDFTVTEPPDSSVLSEDSVHQATNDGMIGIAFSSPGMVAPSHQEPIEWYDPIETPWTPHGPGTSLRRKPSKWKKLGGLFKGKQGTIKASPQSSFYQVRVNDESFQLSPERLMQPDYLPHRHVPHQEMLGTHFDNGHPEAFPNLEHEGRGSEVRHPGDSFLKIDIPSVEMERYSVMFGSVLGNKQPPGLLARRNQTVDRLKVTEREHDLPEAHKPQRRATSPALSKSPAFTLFPNTPTIKAPPGTAVLPTLRSPRRAYTLPAEATHSPYGVNLTVPDPMTLAKSAGRSQGQWSAEPSPPSYDATSADEETMLLERLPTKSYVNKDEEPIWEMIANHADSPESMIPSVTSTPATTPEEDATGPLRPYPLRSDSLAAFNNTTRDKVGPTTVRKPAPLKLLHRAETALPTGTIINRNQNAVHPPMPPPNIEISVARSVSLSRGRAAPRKTLVPLGAHNGQERYGEHQTLVPTVVDVRRGHQPNRSQNAFIENP